MFHELMVSLLIGTASVSPADVPRLLVTDLSHSATVTADNAKTLSAFLSAELGKRKEVRVMSGDDVRRLMELEAGRQSSGCDELSGSCLSEIAGAMGARFAVVGRVSTLGSLMVLEINVFDALQGINMGRQVLRAHKIEEFADSIAGGVEALMEPVDEVLVREQKERDADQAEIPAPSPRAHLKTQTGTSTPEIHPIAPASEDAPSITFPKTDNAQEDAPNAGGFSQTLLYAGLGTTGAFTAIALVAGGLGGYEWFVKRENNKLSVDQLRQAQTLGGAGLFTTGVATVGVLVGLGLATASFLVE